MNNSQYTKKRTGNKAGDKVETKNLSQHHVNGLFFKPYFYVYIATNALRTRLVSGLSGSLSVILSQWKDGYGHENEDCTDLVYWEKFINVEEAIKRESQIRKMHFRKKAGLVSQLNPEWRILNGEFAN